MDNLNKIKEIFLENALEYADSLKGDDYRKTNNILKKLQKLYDEIKLQNRLEIFELFTSHQDDGVRYLAATYSIKSNPDLAGSVLNELTKVNGIVALNARTTLDLWTKGMLNWL